VGSRTALDEYRKSCLNQNSRPAYSESLNRMRYCGPQLCTVLGNKTGVQKTTAQNMRNIKRK
jgi:hypothetical protein